MKRETLRFCSAAWTLTQAAVSGSSVMVMFFMALNIHEIRVFMTHSINTGTMPPP